MKIGANCLPDVLAVLRDVNGDTGLQPVTTMADEGSDDCVAYYCDNMSIDRENASQMTWVTRHRASQSGQKKSLARQQPGFCYAKSSLFGNNNGAPFNGDAVKKLYHGTSIIWDGCVILLHCTMLTLSP